jgi:hypothetical protein
MERWILGKPEATVDQLMAHSQSAAVLLPSWQLIGLPGWHLPAAFITTIALNVLAAYVLLPLYSFAALILMVVAPIPLIIVFLRWRMFRVTSYLGLNGSSKHLIREYRLEFSSLGSLEVEYLVSLPQHPVGPG